MTGGRCTDGNVSFEMAVAVLVTNVLEPLGFDLVCFSKVPYICQGDVLTPYYVLEDAVLVLKRN